MPAQTVRQSNISLPNIHFPLNRRQQLKPPTNKRAPWQGFFPRRHPYLSHRVRLTYFVTRLVRHFCKPRQIKKICKKVAMAVAVHLNANNLCPICEATALASAASAAIINTVPTPIVTHRELAFARVAASPAIPAATNKAIGSNIFTTITMTKSIIFAIFVFPALSGS